MLLENISDTAIESNFWSADKTALNVLLNRLEKSNKSTLSVQNYFKQRAEIEEEYGNQLLKLSQSFEAEECFGVLSVASEMTARAHMDLSQNIKNMLEIPLDTYIKDQDNIKSFMTNQMEESQNMKMLHTENAEKARQNYYKECENPDATQKDIDVSDFEYQKAVKLMESKYTAWTNEWRDSCRTFESLELHRLDYLKAVVKTFSSMISCTCSIDDQTSERMFAAMEDLNVPAEIIKFVRVYRTGSAIPDTLKYKKYKGVPKRNLPKKEKVHPQVDTARKIKDIKLPVKNDEQLRSVTDQLRKIPLQSDSLHEKSMSDDNLHYPSEFDKMSDSNKQYPLNPIYKKTSPSQSDPALNSWYKDQKEESTYNTKSALITPHEREIYIQNNGWNSPPSPNSPTKKSNALFGFLMKKKKSVTGPPDITKLALNKPLPDLNLPKPPPSPLFSPIDFYYSPANDISKKD